MSRRKQANPKFLKVDEERVGQESENTNESLLTNGTPMKEDDVVDPPALDESYTEDYDDEFGPLVIDTEASAAELNSEQGSISPDINYDVSYMKINNNNGNSHPIQNGKNLSPEGDHTEGKRDSECFDVQQSTLMPNLTESSAIVPAVMQQPLTPSSQHSSAGSCPPSPHIPHSGRKGKKSLVHTTAMPPMTGDSDGNFKCPVCPEVLGTSHELTKHIRSHNTITTGATTGNSCTICGKMLSSQSSLDRHMLVHSGERPFKCTVCKMAFTTNGNMHRHTRIHGKESDSAVMKGQSRRGRGGQQKRLTPHRDLNVPSMIGMRPKNLMDFDSMLPGGRDELLPAFVMNRFMYDDEAPPTEQALKRHFDKIDNTLMIPSKRRISYDGNSAIMSPSKRPMVKMVSREEMDQFRNGEEEEMNADADPLHCPVCNKSFLCKYGMESHLETHPTFSIRCQACNLSFRTPRGLNMHKLLVHSESQESQDGDGTENGIDAEEEIPVGFHDLDFMEFSVSKFSLAAKAWCEKNPRQTSSLYHHFTCKDCSKAFPCKSALKLHECSHIPEKMATCPICICDFEDNHKLHAHMIKHLSDKALAEWQKVPDLVNTKLQENVSKHDFLAYFDLKSQDDLNDRGESISRLTSLERRQNEDYFAKLGQAYCSKVQPQKPVAHFLKKELESRKENRVPLVNSADSSMLASPCNSHPDFNELQQFLKATQAAGVLPPGCRGSPYLAAASGALMPPSHPFPSPMSGAGSPLVGPTVSTPAPHLRMLPANAMNMMHAVSLGVHQQISPSSAGSSAAPSPTELDDNGVLGTLDSMHDKLRTKQGMFACKYCDMTFTNYRALKGHTRTHLGLSPYKCNLCSYSSADKSTLIRHLRTHNGERPFQCLVCDFAFTTKANCERHVRKKHLMIDKDDIEKNIGYNKFVSSESTTALDSSFHSPDTVCKYCGVDFKFFRALKHHLRSHSSCRQKPFLCQKCNIGFSTKANCVRHIQKQHLEVPQNLIEQFIHVNEPAMLAASELDQLSDTSMETSHDSACPSPAFNQAQFMSTSTPRNTGSTGPYPRPAHSTPARTTTPAHFPSMHLPIKVEPVDRAYDQPLDFSMKADVKPLVAPVVEKAKPSSNNNNANSPDELPMDLTVRKTSKVELASKVTSKTTPTQFSNVQTLIQCQYCPMGFSNQGILERHQRNRHYQQHQNSLNKTAPAIFHGNSGSGSDSSCELASVNRMLDVTDPHKFKAFFQVPESLDDPSPVKLQTKGRDKETGPLPSFLYSNKLDFERKQIEAGLEKNSDDKLSPSGSVDENFNRKSLGPDEAKSKWGHSLANQENFRFPEEDVGNSSFENEMDSNIEIKEELSDEMSLDSSTDCQKVDGEGIVPKKKRNSYADSPHKLHCPYCPRTFPWVSSLTRHLLTHTGQKPFKCPRCPVTFSTKSNRERHLIRKHGVNMLDPASRQTMDRPFKCHLCIFSSFSTKSNLLKHYHDRHQGSAVPETILRGEHPALHHMDQYEMEMAELEEAQMMENASDVTSEPELEDQMKYEEEVMKEELILDDEPAPLPAPVSSRPLNPERDNYNVDKITECWKCNAKFLSRKLLVRHLKEHSIDFPFKCYLCDASFESRIECLLHQEKVHADDWTQLREKNKVLDIENFSRLMEEIVEKNYKGGDDGNGLPVAQDGTGVEDTQLDAATSDYIQRKVYCSLCPKRFWSLQDLRRHMRSHTGEKPFECDMCQKRFTLKHSMMRHRKKHFEMADSMSASDDEESVHNEDPGKGEKRNLVIESVLNRLRANQDELVGNIHEKEMRGFNGDLSSRKCLAYLQEKQSPMRRDSGLALDPFGGRDILQSLLGVEDAAIDEMLESADSAAERLGVK